MNVVSRRFPVCYKHISNVSQGGVHSVSIVFLWVFQESVKVVLEKFQGCFKSVSTIFEEVSRMFCSLVCCNAQLGVLHCAWDAS